MSKASSRHHHTRHTTPDESYRQERSEISEHLTAVWLLLQRPDLPPWLDTREIAAAAGIAPRTARHHAKYLFDLGLLDREEASPRHLYRLSPQAAKRNPAMYRRLKLHAAIVQARQRHTEQRRAGKDGALGAS
jgi:DNA-binding transcriptional ArsR family regulator